MESVKNSILKTITLCAAVTFMWGWMKIDTNSWIPTITCLVSATWIGLYLYVNVFLYAAELVESEAE